MKSLSLLLIAALFCCKSAIAQAPTAILSEPFDVPDELGAKVFLCSNGNTLFFNATRKDGIEVDVYNRDHKKTAHTTLQGKIWNASNLKHTNLPCIYNIGETVAMFLIQGEEKARALYRLLISPVSGEIIKEDKIAGDMGFWIEKDPLSEAYAIRLYDRFTEDKSKRIEIIHFDGNHDVVQRAYCDGPYIQYQELKGLGMAVQGKEKVTLCDYAYNTKAPGKGDSKVLLSTLSKGNFEHHLLDMPKDIKDANVIYRYNTSFHLMQTFALVPPKHSRDPYGVLILAIDPATSTIKYVAGLDTRLTSLYAARYLKYRKPGYNGMPMDMTINPDGTTSVVMEEVEYVSNVNSNQKINRENLETVGIVDYDQNGKAVNGYAVPKCQLYYPDFLFQSNSLQPLSHDVYHNGTFSLDGMGGNGKLTYQYFSFAYFGTTGARYVIYNDHPRNFDKAVDKELSCIAMMLDANTVCYRLDSNQMTKFYCFGEPNDTFDNRFAFFYSSDYNQASGDYAVMIIEVKRRKKNARIAWVHFQ